MYCGILLWSLCVVSNIFRKCVNKIFLPGHESEGEESEPDLFQCGKCKRMFTSLQKYLKHKAAKDCIQLQTHGQTNAISPVTNGEVMTVDND